jgi:methionyl-tRNA formyltransferase
MTPRLDAGPVLAQGRLAIDPIETAPQLEARLAELGAPLVCETIDQLETGSAQQIPQDPSQRSAAPRLKKQGGAIDWSRSSTAIVNHVRSMEPWPKTFTYWNRPTGQPLRLILGRIRTLDEVASDTQSSSQPGTILVAGGDNLRIATGSGSVAIESIQPAGKKMQSTAEFLRGYSLLAGELLSSMHPS